MERLLNIVFNFKEYFVLALYLIISIILLTLNDNRQIKAIRSYTIGFVGIAQNTLSIIPNIFELKRENEILRQLNVNLSDEVNRLREARLENIRLRSLMEMKERSELHYIAADVLAKSLHLLRNTITLNAGETDSIKPDMPIIAETGLVGKIVATSGHYSIGQLMLNKDFRASAKIQRSRVDGIVAWDGGSVVRLKNVAKTQDVREGDVVTTSEYSNVFPREVKIGYVSHISEKGGSLFKEIEVTPSVDFASLEQVFIVTTTPDTERVAIERRLVRTK